MTTDQSGDNIARCLYTTLSDLTSLSRVSVSCKTVYHSLAIGSRTNLSNLIKFQNRKLKNMYIYIYIKSVSKENVLFYNDLLALSTRERYLVSSHLNQLFEDNNLSKALERNHCGMIEFQHFTSLSKQTDIFRGNPIFFYRTFWPEYGDNLLNINILYNIYCNFTVESWLFERHMKIFFLTKYQSRFLAEVF